MEDLTIEDVKRLRLEPGDTLALLVRDAVTAEVAERFLGELRSVFPSHRVVVLSDGMDLGVVSRFRA